MKAQKTFLVCFTSWGSICLRKEFLSKNAAVKEAKWMIDNGFAFSYKTKKIS
jgi:hypothetical protein